MAWVKRLSEWWRGEEYVEVVVRVPVDEVGALMWNHKYLLHDIDRLNRDVRAVARFKRALSQASADPCQCEFCTASD